MARLRAKLAAVVTAIALILTVPTAYGHMGMGLGMGFGNGPHQSNNSVASSGFLTSITSTPVAMQNLLLGSYDLSSASAHWTNNVSGGNVCGGGPCTTTAVNVSGVTLPDSTTGTVTSLTIPQVSTANTFSTITANVGATVNSNPVGYGVWAQMQTPGCTLYMSYSVGTTFNRVAIPYNGGAWTQIQGSIPATSPFTYAQSPQPQIGINKYDSSQASSSGACTVYLTGAYTIKQPYDQLVTYADVKQGGPIATTTTYVSGGSSKSLGTYNKTGGGTGNLRFRDFSLLTASPSNPIISPNTSETWQDGGISNAYLSQDFQYGGYYWGFVNCTNSVDHTAWMSFCLYKSNDANNLVWTEDTTSAPYFQVYGSTFANPSVSAVGAGFTASASGTATWTGGGCPVPPVIAVTTNSSGQLATATPSPNNGIGTGSCPAGAWPGASGTSWSYSGVGTPSTPGSFTFAGVRGTGTINSFQLHSAWYPFGCNVGGTAYSFCIAFSASNASVNFQTYLGYSNSIDSGWTLYGCTLGSMSCAAPTPIIAAQGSQNIPAGNSGYNVVGIKNVGGATGTNYMYAADGNLGGPVSSVFAAPANTSIANSGTAWVYQGQLLPTKLSGVDWDYGAAYQDTFAFQNHCGFFEVFYTAQNNAGFGVYGTQKQLIGYAIGPTPTGPWFKYQVGPIIPGTAPLWGGLAGGDSVANEINGNFVYTGNYDNGVNVSAAVGATMPQGTCP